ncbi:MAG TPA: DNA-binding protein [Oceanithermus profundus]|uniref:DNA-binding protein n=1 Tax=Oceanithermus profundus TaxID=187137 RepID=A0A7C4VKW7_9DEIN|nr:DNA-binding protein [Oceanithermus profundus]
MPVPVVSVFGSSRTAPGTPAWKQAEAWGRALAEGGFAVASGGYGGSMEAVSRGAKAAGGLVIGVTAPDLFKSRSGANAHVDLELPAPTLTGRIERMLEMSRAALALPGGLGTLTEILVAWNRAYIQRLQGEPPLPLGVDAAWRPLLKPHLELSEREFDLITFLEGPEELAAFLSWLRSSR